MVALKVEKKAPHWVASLVSGMVRRKVEMMAASWAAYWGLILVLQLAGLTVATTAVSLVEKPVGHSVANLVVDLVEQKAVVMVAKRAAEMDAT